MLDDWYIGFLVFGMLDYMIDHKIVFYLLWMLFLITHYYFLNTN